MLANNTSANSGLHMIGVCCEWGRVPTQAGLGLVMDKRSGVQPNEPNCMPCSNIIHPHRQFPNCQAANSGIVQSQGELIWLDMIANLFVLVKVRFPLL